MNRDKKDGDGDEEEGKGERNEDFSCVILRASGRMVGEGRTNRNEKRWEN